MNAQLSRLWPIGLIILVLTRLAMSWLLLNDIPKLLLHEGWYFSTGGDQTLYLEIAHSILAGQPIAAKVSVGQPLIMAAFLRLTGETNYLDILPWLVILNGFVLGGLSVWVMGQLAYALTRNHGQALATAGIWTFSAYGLWLALGAHREADTLRSAYLPRQLWMNGLTDPPSLFMAILGMLLVARAVAQTSPAGRRRDAFFLSAGLALGLAATFRIHTLAMAGVVVLAVLWVRQWRGALLIGSGLILGLGPQFWYNATVSGHPLNMPYISEWLGFDSQGQFYFSRTTMHFSPQFLLDSLTLLARGNPALAVVGAATGVAAVYLFIHCWRRCGSFAAIVMFGAPLASLGLHVITYVFIIDPIRFALPALSMGIPAGVWSLFFAASTLQTKIVSLRSVPGAKGTL